MKRIAQWFAAVAIGILSIGGFALAASGLFNSCNNCTVNVVSPDGAPVVTNEPSRTLGSVGVSNEYNATTTGYNTVLSNTTDLVISTNTAWRWGTDAELGRRGSLGSVVLAGPAPGNGVLEFYDATTTNVQQRAAGVVTSSIILASLPTSNSTGTYTYDVRYQTGLIAVIRGSVPTSTITYR